MKKRLVTCWYFILFLLPCLSLIYFLNSLQFELKPLRLLIARISYKVLCTKYEVELNGSTIIVLHRNRLSSFEISRDSTGWKGILLLAALIFSTPYVKLSKKFKHFLLLSPLLFLVNLARIISSIMIGIEYGMKAFNLWHSILWSYGFVCCAIAMWGIWLILAYAKKI